MENRITIEGRGGAFGAYIARPKTLPAPAVVVLHEVFGVNADIRKTCDELAVQGFIAIAPDLFWQGNFYVDMYRCGPNPETKATLQPSGIGEARNAQGRA